MAKLNMNLGVGIGLLDNFASYPYTLHGTLGEFIDNSIQAYLDEKNKLKKVHKKNKEKPYIKIRYIKAKKRIEIIDNSTGISEEELDRALFVGTKKNRIAGEESLGKYNMGFKTAARWLCSTYMIQTKRYDEEREIEVIVDHKQIKHDEKVLPCVAEDRPKKGNKSYTRFFLEDLNHDFDDKKIEKTRIYLASMFRYFLDTIDIYFDGDLLEWTDFKIHKDDKGFAGPKGKILKWSLDIGPLNPRDPNSLEIKKGSYIGILQMGKGGDSGRANSGFSIFRNRRMIQGWPETWRPDKSLNAGTNTSYNQRLVGELHVSTPEVSFAKDGLSEDQLIVLDDYIHAFLSTTDLRRIANDYPVEDKDKKPSTKVQIQASGKSIKKKLQNSNVPYITDKDLVSDEVIKLQIEQYFEAADKSLITTIPLKRFNIKYVFNHLGEDKPFVIYHVKGGLAKDVYVMINRDHNYLQKRLINEDQYAEFICCMCIARYKIEKDKRLTMDSFFTVLNDVLNYQ